MAKQVVWSPLAQKDFEFLLDYLQENWDSKVVLGFIEVTYRLITQISRNPKQFPLIHTDRKIRKCVLTKHNALFYREGKDKIDLLRLYNTRQDPKRLDFK